MSASLALLLIVSVLSLFSPYRMGVLPTYDHTKNVSAKAQPQSMGAALQLPGKKSGSSNMNAQPLPPEAREASQLFESARVLITHHYEKTGVMSSDIQELIEKYPYKLEPTEQSKLAAAVQSKKLHVDVAGDTFTVIVTEMVSKDGTKSVERWHYFGMKPNLRYPVYTQQDMVFDYSKTFNKLGQS
jgi:hypothetical protein